MADTYTTNLNLTKPQIGGDTDSWGSLLNANMDSVDAIFAGAGTGTSVGLNVGTGKTLSVAGTATFSGSFTVSSTLNASGTITGAAFTNYFASPPAIGGTAPNAGTFSTLGVGRAVVGPGAFSVHTATNVNLIAQTGTVDATGVMLTASNDGYTGIVPLQLRGSYINFTNASGGECGRWSTSGNLVVGAPGVEVYTAARLQVHQGTNVNFIVQTGTLDSSAVMLSAVNDAYSAVTPFTVRGSYFGVVLADGIQHLTVASSGYVGVGTTSPAYQLDVNGSIRSSAGGFVFPDNTVQTTASVQFGLGIGQTWQNVLGSRASGTNYTNSTGKPIAVLFHCAYGFTVTVDGVVISSQGYINAQWPGQYFIVPPGSVYSVSSYDGTFSSWAELR